MGSSGYFWTRNKSAAWGFPLKTNHKILLYVFPQPQIKHHDTLLFLIVAEVFTWWNEFDYSVFVEAVYNRRGFFIPQAISCKGQHSISYTLSRNQTVVVEYTHDKDTDMFQVRPCNMCVAFFNSNVQNRSSTLGFSEYSLKFCVVKPVPAPVNTLSAFIWPFSLYPVGIWGFLHHLTVCNHYCLVQCLLLWIWEMLYKLGPQAWKERNMHNLFQSRLIGSVLSVTSVIRASYREALSLLIKSFIFRRVSSWVLLTEEEIALSRCLCFMRLLFFFSIYINFSRCDFGTIRSK